MKVKEKVNLILSMLVKEAGSAGVMKTTSGIVFLHTKPGSGAYSLCDLEQVT